MKTCSCERYGREFRCYDDKKGRTIHEKYPNGIIKVGYNPTKIRYCRHRTRSRIENLILKFIK